MTVTYGDDESRTFVNRNGLVVHFSPGALLSLMTSPCFDETIKELISTYSLEGGKHLVWVSASGTPEIGEVTAWISSYIAQE
jgi:hypothetical protein